MKVVKRKIDITLEYLDGKQDTEKKIFSGGVKKGDEINNLTIDVCEDEVYDEDIDDFIKSGKLQVIISGNDMCLEEFGKYLIALARYNTNDPHYHDHFDDIKTSEGRSIAVIIRKQ